MTALLLSVSVSGCTRSNVSEVSRVDTTSIINNLLVFETKVQYQMGSGMEENTIQCRTRLILQDLSDNDALTH